MMINQKLRFFTPLIAALLLTSCTNGQPDRPADSTDETLYAQRQEGRLMTAEEQISKLISQLTLEEKSLLLRANGKFSVAAIERLGIHELWMSDGPHGVRHEFERHEWARANRTDDTSTYLPPLTSVAASWDPAMAKLHGHVLGSEARHRDKDIILGPGVNLARVPINGRNFEYMGEDPYLAAKLSVAEIKAIQANDVAATVKHYALNTQELNRSGVDATPDERTLREVYLPAFEAAVVDADVWAVMGAYNSVYGTNANQNKFLVRDILKDEWGFKGLLMTDWNCEINTYDAAMNGLDIEMGSDAPTYDDYHFGKELIEKVKTGIIPEHVIDEKVRRVLRVHFAIGKMDRFRQSGQRNTPEHRQAALKIAQNSVTLLKNDHNILPLDASQLKNVLVIGPNADKLHGWSGGSSQVLSEYEVTPLAGLKAKLGENVQVTHMRARNTSLVPIAGEYVESRHWTGTPAWEVTVYKDKSRKQALYSRSVSDSEFMLDDSSHLQYLSMLTKIKPLQTGTHTLKVKADGRVKLLIDGVVRLEGTGDGQTELAQDVTLNDGQSYQFELQYDGQHSVLLGWEAPNQTGAPETEYLAAAQQADAVFYIGGLSHDDDREAVDRRDMILPGGQDEVISKLLRVNPNTVILLMGGSPVEMPWIKDAHALVWGWYGGMEGGHAYADVIFGDINPNAKLPMTFPKTLADTAPFALDDYKSEYSRFTEGVYIGYRWFEQQAIEPLFPFGYGLSYTRFEYSQLDLPKTFQASDNHLEVKVTVKNTGQRAGAEIVQLYLGDKESSVDRPAKELKGFGKVFLLAGESKTLTMTLTPRDLSFWDVTLSDWRAEAGDFHVYIGASSQDIRLESQFQYQP